MRRRGEDAGFDKSQPKYDDSLLPKLSVDQKELALVNEVRQMLEQGEDKQQLITAENISNHLPGEVLSKVVDQIVANLIKK